MVLPLFSLIIKEQYPFSHYPMYSGWSSRTHYFYIADENGPIQAKSVFKVSVPRIKKLYGGIVDDIEDTGKDYRDFTEADFAEAGRRLLKKLRTGVPKKRLGGQLKDHERTPLTHPDGRPLFVKDVVASDLTLVRVDIQREGRKFATEERAIVTTNGKNQIVTPGEP